MDVKASTISFEIKYAGRPVFCEAVMQQTGMQVFFNGCYMATIENDTRVGWYLTEGTILPDEIIDNIGAHIDGYLD